MKFFISTFGCKVNQYESQIILELFLNSGFKKTENFKDADIVIINSCTVTKESSKKVLRYINKVRKENKRSLIVLVGCLPEAFPDESIKRSGADIVLGNKDKLDVLKKVEKYLKSKINNFEVNTIKDNETSPLNSINGFENRTRAFIKIQDGCNQFCSYCIIPYARGRSRSRRLEDIYAEVKDITLAGYKEIVLVGINLAMYGKDFDNKNSLCDVIRELSEIDDLKRIRLSSMEPQFMNKETIKELSNFKKLCPHFHISLQSGCDNILKKMNRHYTVSKYAKIVENIHHYFDNASITTDVMVGFPGETEKDFEESLNFVKNMQFYKVHVFPFSARKGTVAQNLPDQISKEVKKTRCKKMLSLSEKLKESFLKNQIGKTVSVLFENRTNELGNKGHASNYVIVYLKNDSQLEGKILDVKINSCNKESCIGSISVP